MSSRKWTSEQKQKQRNAIHQWKPWERSTGPKTPQGKEIASKNAFKGGLHAKLRSAIKDMNQLLRMQKSFID
jgi:hypothetical protein